MHSFCEQSLIYANRCNFMELRIIPPATGSIVSRLFADSAVEGERAPYGQRNTCKCGNDTLHIAARVHTIHASTRETGDAYPAIHVPGVACDTPSAWLVPHAHTCRANRDLCHWPRTTPLVYRPFHARGSQVIAPRGKSDRSADLERDSEGKSRLTCRRWELGGGLSIIAHAY